MLIETSRSALIKTLLWVFLAALAAGYSSFVFVSDWQMAIKIAVLAFVLFFVLIVVFNPFLQKINLGKKRIEPVVIWFTGLSGAGKTTIAEALVPKLREKGYRTQHLDGDKVRKIFPKTGFSKEERDNHIQRIAYTTSLLQRSGSFVICSFVSPYQSSRLFAKGLCDKFLEVYVSTPLETCEKRDLKGLYKKARAGEVQQFTGISDPYEKPTNADLEIDTTNLNVDQSVDLVLEALHKKYQI